MTRDAETRKLVGVVLDLLQGKPSLYKMSFFADDNVYGVTTYATKSMERTSIAKFDRPWQRGLNYKDVASCVGIS